MPDKAVAPIIADQIQRSLPQVKSGTLRFFGVWFGRPYDNIHTVQDARAEADHLIITFDNGETLSIWEPTRFKISNTVFEIASASRVLWQWYSYGAPQIPENLFYEDYRVEANLVYRTTNWHNPNLQPSLSEPAVKIY